MIDRLRNKNGQGIVEYALLLGIFIALMTVAAQAVLSGYSGAFSRFASALSRTVYY